MNLKMHIVRIAALFCVCLLPKMSFGSACTTQTLASLLGTTCSIGDVNYAFTPDFGGFGLTASDVTLTPDGSDPLNPVFFLTPSAGGPFTTSALGVGTGSSLQFQFSWDATILTTGLQFGSATATLVNPVITATSPSAGFIFGENEVGLTIPGFPVVQTGGPNFNPNTGTIDLPSLTGSNGAGVVVSVNADDDTGTGATSSLDAFELQYHLTPTPEPSSLLLFGAGLLGLAMALKKPGS